MATSNFYCKGSDTIMITKSNTLVEAGYDLTMAEHDLMTLAINKIHKQQTGSKQVMITAKEFAAANQVSDIYAYKTLKDTAKTLGEKKLKFTLYRDLSIISDKEDDKLSVLKPPHNNFTTLRAEYNWLQGISYQDQQGYLLLHFSDPLAFLIEHTGKAYTKYDYVKTVVFTGTSSKRIYELITKWQKLGSTPEMSVFEWKDLFGVADKYPKVAEFRRRILDPAIEQINQQGDFKLEIMPIKAGRNITHFRIDIKVKRKSDTAEANSSNTKKTLHLLTASQASTFAVKLANDANFGSNFARSGESMTAFISRINEELQRDHDKVTLYMPYLTKLGFKF